MGTTPKSGQRITLGGRPPILPTPHDQAISRLHELRLLIQTSEKEPITNHRIRLGVDEVVGRIPDIQDAEMQDAAHRLCRIGQAIIGARYLHHLFPEVTQIIATQGTPVETEPGETTVPFSLEAKSTDGSTWELVNDAQATLMMSTLFEQLFVGGVMPMVEPPNESVTTYDVAAIYAHHPEPENTEDEVFGFGDFLTV